MAISTGKRARVSPTRFMNEVTSNFPSLRRLLIEEGLDPLGIEVKNERGILSVEAEITRSFGKMKKVLGWPEYEKNNRLTLMCIATRVDYSPKRIVFNVMLWNKDTVLCEFSNIYFHIESCDWSCYTRR